MGGSHSRVSYFVGNNNPVNHIRYIPTNDTPLNENGLRVVCPRCRKLLVPPSAHFLCPCGQELLLASTANTPSHFLGGTEATEFERRIFSLLNRLPPNDPNRIFLSALVARFPRTGPNGEIDHQAVASIGASVRDSTKGASEALINLLPIRKFEESSLPPNATDDMKQCAICLEDYKDNDELKTLVCLHHFHNNCASTWLKSNKQCPVCRIAVDIDSLALVEEQIRRETAEHRDASGAGAPK